MQNRKILVVDSHGDYLFFGCWFVILNSPPLGRYNIEARFYCKQENRNIFLFLWSNPSIQRTRAAKRLGVFRFRGVARGADRGVMRRAVLSLCPNIGHLLTVAMLDFQSLGICLCCKIRTPAMLVCVKTKPIHCGVQMPKN